jgi:hypothetical protein
VIIHGSTGRAAFRRNGRAGSFISLHLHLNIMMLVVGALTSQLFTRIGSCRMPVMGGVVALALTGTLTDDLYKPFRADALGHTKGQKLAIVAICTASQSWLTRYGRAVPGLTTKLEHVFAVASRTGGRPQKASAFRRPSPTVPERLCRRPDIGASSRARPRAHCAPSPERRRGTVGRR